MSNLLKNLVIFVGLAALAGVGYYLLAAERSQTLDGTNQDSITATADTQAFLRRLADLQTIQLSSDIFGDQRFQSLRDFRTVVDAVSYGRELPFNEANQTGVVSE